MGKIRKTTRGLYTTQFTVDGKRYTVYGHTKKECEEKERTKRTEIEEGLNTADAEQTLDRYFESWIADKEKRVNPYTVYQNRSVYNVISGTVIAASGKKFGELKLKDIKVQHVKDLQTALQESGRKSGTVNRTISELKSILESAVSDDILRKNPARNKNIRPIAKTEEAVTDTIHRALTKDETVLFLKTAEECGSWYLNLYRLLLHTGLRCGEAGAIIRSDINGTVLQISRTLTIESGSVVVGKRPKTTAGNRTIPLDDEAMAAILNQQKVNSLLQEGRQFGPGKSIFRAPRGGLISARNVDLDIDRICKKAGIERFGVHAFRDTFATRCAESGMKPEVLMKLMGHTDINLTYGLYNHVSDERKAEEMKVVNFE